MKSEPAKEQGYTEPGQFKPLKTPPARNKDSLGEIATGVMLATGLTQWGWGYGWGCGIGWWGGDSSPSAHISSHSDDYLRPGEEYDYEDNEFLDNDFDLDFGGDFGI